MSSYSLIKLFGLDFCWNDFVILPCFHLWGWFISFWVHFSVGNFSKSPSFPPVVSEKKHRLRKDGTLPWLHPDAELQVTVHYEAWSIGRLPWGAGVFFAFPWKSLSLGIPGKKWCKGWRWIGGVFFFLRWCVQIRILIFVFTPIWEKWSILIHVAICRF